MYALNRHLFLLINASDHPAGTIVAFANFVAADIVLGAVLVLVALWAWGDQRKRAGLLATTLATLAALALNQLLGQFWYEPRPFMIGLGHTLAEHAPENSFPSDHGTFMFAIGLGLIATRASRLWGVAVCAAGILVAWARIYLGLHFPVDMLSSAFVAGACALAAALVKRPISRFVMPLGNRLYDVALDRLRLPQGLFPRTLEPE